MWGLKINSQKGQHDYLLNIQIEIILGLLVLIIVIRHFTAKYLRTYFNVNSLKPKHNQNTLEQSYLYHLSIVILIASDIKWNIMDLALWTFSYVCIGQLRKVIYIVKMQNDTMLNDVTYQSNIFIMLFASKRIGLFFLLISISYLSWVLSSFFLIPFKFVTLLLFPTIMLIIDSGFLLIQSFYSEKQIHCFYNPNIRQIPTIYKLDVYHKIICSGLKIWHFFNLSRLFLPNFFKKINTSIQYIECFWIFSVFSALFVTSKSLMRLLSQYSSSSKLLKDIQKTKYNQTSSPGQICIICMEELLNCRQISSCIHLFHDKCLFRWLQSKSDCPICRTHIDLL